MNSNTYPTYGRVGSMYKERGIDFLQFSHEIQPRKYPDLLSDERLLIEIPPIIGGYDRAFRCRLTNTLYHHNHRKYHTSLVIMTSQALKDFLELDKRFLGDEMEFLHFAINSMKAKVSRIDLQITQGIDHDGLITVSDVIQWDREGLINSPAFPQSGAIIGKNDSEDIRPETFYFGDLKRRGKRGLFRVYDKGINEGLQTNFLTRFELEEKRDKAIVTSNALVKGMSIEQAIVNRWDVNNEAWKALVQASPAPIPRSAKNDKIELIANKWAWLDTLKPSIAQLIADTEINEGSGAERFNRWISEVAILAESRIEAHNTHRTLYDRD